MRLGGFIFLTWSSNDRSSPPRYPRRLRPSPLRSAYQSLEISSSGRPLDPSSRLGSSPRVSMDPLAAARPGKTTRVGSFDGLWAAKSFRIGGLGVAREPFTWRVGATDTARVGSVRQFLLAPGRQDASKEQFLLACRAPGPLYGVVFSGPGGVGPVLEVVFSGLPGVRSPLRGRFSWPTRRRDAARGSKPAGSLLKRMRALYTYSVQKSWKLWKSIPYWSFLVYARCQWSTRSFTTV